MPARFAPHFAEIADKCGGLTAVVRHEVENLLQTDDFLLFAVNKFRREFRSQFCGVLRFVQTGVTLAGIGGFQFHKAPLLQNFQSLHDTAAFLSKRFRYRIGIEGVPFRSLFRVFEQVRDEQGRFAGKRRKDFFTTRFGLYFVTGVERCSLFQDAVQFEIGQRSPQNEGTQVVAVGKFNEIDVEFRAA